MLFRDLSYSLRAMKRQPGFTAVVIVSLALGIAVNTAVFSIVNAILLGALPVRDPGGLHVVSGQHSTTTYPDYREFRDQCGGIFAGMSAHFPLAPANLAGSGPPERVWGQLVSGNYFSLIGVPMALGRGITPQEDGAIGQNPAVVLGYGLWQRKFGGDVAILGKTVTVSGRPYTVTGVAAPGFSGTDRGILSQFWAPLAMRNDFMPELAKSAESRNATWLEMTVRLKPGVSRSQAIAALNAVNQRLNETYRKGRKGTVSLTAAGGLPVVGSFASGFAALLMATAILVLLIACSNAASMLLARAVERRQEVGVRLAIGAGRGRLIRQLLTESTLLALMGAMGGLALSLAAARALSGFHLPVQIPVQFDLSPDYRVLGFTVAVALVTGVLSGLAPALAATRGNLTSAGLFSGQRTGARRLGLSSLLVSVQVTLSVVLLAGAGLFLRSLQRAAALDLGISPAPVLLLTVDPKTSHYSDDQTREFLRQLQRRVEALPGVRSMSAANMLPLSFAQSGEEFGSPQAPTAAPVETQVSFVTSRYFETVGIPILRGRDFRDDLDLRNPTMLISQAMARRIFGQTDPMGRQVRTGGGKTYEVIGITGDSRSVSFGESVRANAYAYLPTAPDQIISLLGLTLLVKAEGDPARMIGPVREQVQALDRNMAVFNVNTMSRHVENAFLVPRLCATLFGVFGLVGLTLATVGLFGMISYSVRGRTREIGIRMALGAGPAGVLRLVLRQGLTIVAVSLVVGSAFALALGRVTEAFLYGVAPTDPVTFSLVPLVLGAAALAAVLVPARRALRVDPITALRTD